MVYQLIIFLIIYNFYHVRTHIHSRDLFDKIIIKPFHQVKRLLKKQREFLWWIQYKWVLPTGDLSKNKEYMEEYACMHSRRRQINIFCWLRIAEHNRTTKKKDFCSTSFSCHLWIHLTQQTINIIFIESNFRFDFLLNTNSKLSYGWLARKLFVRSSYSVFVLLLPLLFFHQQA